MKLTMLGTGNALVTECYNTCFLMEEQGRLFLVVGGGGNTVLRQIKCAGYDWMDIRHIFVTHKHIDHLLGIVWMVRMICQFMNHGEYKGEAYIYSHAELIALLRDLTDKLLLKKEAAFIDHRLHLIEVTDGETMDIILLHFEKISLKNQGKKTNGATIERLTGVKNYDAHEDQIKEICGKIFRNSYKDMRQRVAEINYSDMTSGSTNFIVFLERFESSDNRWITALQNYLKDKK